MIKNAIVCFLRSGSTDLEFFLNIRSGIDLLCSFPDNKNVIIFNSDQPGYFSSSEGACTLIL